MENDVKILNKENELLKSEIKEIKVVLNQQNNRLNGFDINQNKLSKENNLLKKEIIKLYNQMNEIANENDKLKSETIKLNSEIDILLRFPNNINNNYCSGCSSGADDGKETNESFKNSSDFSKWASLLTKVTNSERTIYDEMKERKVLSEKISKIENEMNDTIKIAKSNEEKIKNQCTNDEEKYNINFKQYKLLLDQYKDKVEIRLNKLDHNCCDTLIECKKMCRSLEEIIREEVKSRMQNEKEIDNKIFVLKNEEKNNQLNEYIKIENRLSEMSNGLHSYIESEILENKLFVNKYVTEQLEMINVLNNRCDELFKSDNNIISDMKIIDNNNKIVNDNNIKRINQIKESEKEMFIMYECDKLVNQILLDEYKDYLLEEIKVSENNTNIAVDKINTSLNNEVKQSIHCCRISIEQIGNKLESYNDDSKVRFEKINDLIEKQNIEINEIKNKEKESSDILTLVETLGGDLDEIKIDINERFDNIRSKETVNNNEIIIKTTVDSVVNSALLEYSNEMLYKSITEMEYTNQEMLRNQYLGVDQKNSARISELEKDNKEKFREENNRISELEMKHKEDIEQLEEKIKEMKEEKEEEEIFHNKGIDYSEINKSAENERAITELNEKIESNNMKIIDIKSDVDERLKRIEEKEEDSKENINKLNDMENKLKNIEVEISEIKANNVKENNVEIMNIKSDVDERLKRIEEKEEESKENINKLNDMENKLKNIEVEISEIKANNVKDIKEERFEEPKEEKEFKENINKLNDMENKLKNIEVEISEIKANNVKEIKEEKENQNESKIKESEIKDIIQRLTSLEEARKEIEKLTNENENDLQNLSKISEIIERIKRVEKNMNNNEDNNIKRFKDLIIDVSCFETLDKIITNIVEEVDINSLFEEEEEDEYIPVEDDKYHKGYDKENDNYYYFNRKTGDTTFDVPAEWKEKSNIKIGDIIENGKYEVCATSEGELYKKNIENGECEML